MQKSAIFFSSTGLACLLAAGSVALAGSVPFQYVNETATRVVGTPSTSTADTQEVDYAWGDLDGDGDIDLVSVRKQPFTSPGKQRNVLFMNVNGVLTDMTSTYANSAINTPVADFGFGTPTNDRDVIMIDVDGDGFLDVVTATTISDGDPKHIGHPRIYINQGGIGPAWGGLVFDNARFPQLMTSTVGLGGAAQTPSAQNPRFCSVAGGDTTGDGRPELFFGDYDSAGGGTGGVGEPFGIDMNNKYLLNDGNGFFSDVTEARLTGMALISGSRPVFESAFGAAAAIADMNGDSHLDIIYQTALTDPQYIGILYNNPAAPGFFTTNAQILYTQGDAPYFVSAEDLNNDGRLDVMNTSDFVDRYRLQSSSSNPPPGQPAVFNASQNFPGSTGGFGAQNMAIDLNGDGFKDVLIADVDVDIPPCPTGRIADILLNNANPPNVTFTANSGGIPTSSLNGVFHFAVFDLDGDTWNDIVIGKCTGMEVWMFDGPDVLCPADINGDGVVDGLDLGILLAQWSGLPGSPTCPCTADLTGDGLVNGLDLGQLLADWSIPAGSPACD